PLPRLHQDGREVPVRLRFEEEDRTGLDRLADFPVPTAAGDSAQLQGVTSPRFLAAERSIHRRDKRIAYELTLDLAEDGADEARRRLDAVVAALSLPDGVRTGAPTPANDHDEDV